MDTLIRLVEGLVEQQKKKGTNDEDFIKTAILTFDKIFNWIFINYNEYPESSAYVYESFKSNVFMVMFSLPQNHEAKFEFLFFYRYINKTREQLKTNFVLKEIREGKPLLPEIICEYSEKEVKMGIIIFACIKLTKKYFLNSNQIRKKMHEFGIEEEGICRGMRYLEEMGLMSLFYYDKKDNVSYWQFTHSGASIVEELGW